ncbi:hypothetical protein ACFZB6_29535 [Streptomyces syringium]|uniref:hypothetical protein n=2 Tax=Streptomyces syringium TaxID=76729 RepID=UPI0036EE7CC0
MSTSERSGESMGEEAGPEAAGAAGEPAQRRQRPGARRLVGQVVTEAAVVAARAAVSVWAPEWSQEAEVMTEVARNALRLRWGRGGRPRSQQCLRVPGLSVRPGGRGCRWRHPRPDVWRRARLSVVAIANEILALWDRPQIVQTLLEGDLGFTA